jgi:hypothetical protein
MSKGNATETDLLAKIFNATALPWDAATQLDVHLHTADPGEAGISTTSEATYTGYALVTNNRNSGAWTVSGNQVSNAALIQFPICTAGSNSITYASVTPAGSTQILYRFLLTTPLAVSVNIRPQFSAGTLVAQED